MNINNKMEHTTNPILPPAMLGILGGGQLGRMFTIAAKTMGYRVTVLDPNPMAPAAAFADVHLCASFDDEQALSQLSRCAAVTTEFENVNADSMRHLSKYTVVSPSGDCVAIAQDREQEKSWIHQAGLATAPYRVIHSLNDINDDCQSLLPGILKTATLGYDGKGQIRVHDITQLRAAFLQLNEVRCVLEKILDLRAEISVVVCRLDDQHVACFPPSENQHKNGIIVYSVVPARLPVELQEQAKQWAKRLAKQLNYVGVLTVEMFVVGDDGHLVINEIAPRSHNSGHYTLNACTCDQFQQQVRLMCGIVPAEIRLLSACCMANILGDAWMEGALPHWEAILAQPSAHLYLYGKQQARKGRKMGHFTVLAADADAAYQLATHLHDQLPASSS